MKVIYYCYGSAHSSVISAAIHLGLLPSDRIPSAQEIMATPYFDRTDSREIGTCFFVGRDEDGREVYIMGMGPGREVVKRAILSVLKVFGIDTREFALVDALPSAGLLVRTGGILSRRLGLVRLGRPLVVRGIQRNYWAFCDFVRSTKESLSLPTDRLPVQAPSVMAPSGAG